MYLYKLFVTRQRRSQYVNNYINVHVIRPFALKKHRQQFWLYYQYKKEILFGCARCVILIIGNEDSILYNCCQYVI